MTHRTRFTWRTIAVVWLVAFALHGCTNGTPANHESVLVCSVDGQESFRSKPAKFWKDYSGDGEWTSMRPEGRYQQRNGEYCHVTYVKVHQ